MKFRTKINTNNVMINDIEYTHEYLSDTLPYIIAFCEETRQYYLINGSLAYIGDEDNNSNKYIGDNKIKINGTMINIYGQWKYHQLYTYDLLPWSSKSRLTKYIQKYNYLKNRVSICLNQYVQCFDFINLT